MVSNTSTSIEHTQQAATATLPRVVIIGAGFGGLQAAKALEKAPVHLTVIDRDNYHLFQPMLYQVATAGLSPDDISMSIRQILSKQQNTEVCLAEVTDIDVQGQKVVMDETSIPFDYLIIATGACSNYFGHEDWQEYAPGLKTLDDGMKVRDKILLAFEEAEQEPDAEKRQALLTFVLVGGGPTGVELAGAIADLAHQSLSGNFRYIRPSAARIILVEGESRIIPSFPTSLSLKAEQQLKSMGVEVRTGLHVKAIDENSVMIGDEHVSTKNVIWTAGVKASPAGKWLNAEVDHDGRVKVKRDLTVPGHPNIFVIGDTALVTQKGKHLPGVAPVAIQEGRYAASRITDRVAGKEHSTPFYYFNKGTLATVGRSFAVVDIGIIRFTGLLAWFTWLLVHLFFLIGFRNRLLVLIQYAWSYFTFQKGSRVILPAYIKSTSNVTSN
ncbi:MAG TPA: NAD(P)/FAD-dependent oxidoreductase, partial [Ktedonobacteraceae bacterium]|nr:NAD(P)/FAD-dependent oxidoreductase [Ktedonobacteraceae bacterium]